MRKVTPPLGASADWIDSVDHGRVRAVYAWAGSLVVITQPVQLAIMRTGAWRAVAAWLTS